MFIENFEQCLQLAIEFLATKERKNYYCFTVIEEGYYGELACYNQLPDNEVAQLRALQDKYGKEFVEHLEEVYDDPDIIHDLSGGNEIIDIDLDNIIHMYVFKIHELKPDGTIYVHSCLINLKDEEYARLLAWHLYDEHLTINILRQRDDNLYSVIMRGVDQYFVDDDEFLMVDNPYVPTLDEAKADTETIIHLHDIKLSGGYRYLGMVK